MKAILVDVGNLFFCIGKRWPGRRLNYEKLLGALDSDKNSVRAYAYGLDFNGESDKFQNYLKVVGFETKYKDAIPRDFGNEYRSDWLITMTLDIVKLISRVDLIILCSSNPELIPLINWVRDQGVSCHIVACGISHILRESCDYFQEIEENWLMESINDENQKVTQSLELPALSIFDAV